LRLNSEDQAPAAQTTAWQAIGADHRLAGDRAALGHHADHRAARRFQRPHGAVGQDPGAQALRRRGDRRRRLGRFGASVARRQQARLPAPPGPGQSPRDLGRGQQPAVDLMLPGDLEPVLEAGQLLVAVAEVEHAALMPADVGLQLPLQPAPDAQGFHDRRHLGRVAALLAHEAPVAARLLARDTALLAERDGYAPLGQEIGGRAADNAAADDHHLGRGGQASVLLTPIAHCAPATPYLLHGIKP
jgi:hypothetical protein